MSITDELRKWAEDNTLRDRVLATYPPQHAVHGVLETLLRIADRIDAEHESAMYDMRREHDEWVAERDANYVKLPVDADGVTIRVGDVLDGYGKTIEVVDMRYGRSGWVLISRDGNGYADTFAFTHYHEPTVDGVLLDACKAYHGLMLESMSDVAHDMPAPSEVIAKYAKMFRLAGGDE